MIPKSEHSKIKVGTRVQWSDGHSRIEGSVTATSTTGIEVKWDDDSVGTFHFDDLIRASVWLNETL